MAKSDWARLLEEEDAEALWNALYHLVGRHPAVKPLYYTSDGAAVASHLEINADITQELFLELLRKRRFDHYANSNYSSSAIENELVYIEVPNMIGARLRKRYPESFRMARRVSSLLKSSLRFRRLNRADGAQPIEIFDSSARHFVVATGACASCKPGTLVLQTNDQYRDGGGVSSGRRPRRGRMISQVFGLREWPLDKPLGDPGRFADLIKNVPMRSRDKRFVGRSASSQLIISNRELEELMAEVFIAIDSPADVRSIRQLVLSKVPLQDYRIASLDELFGIGDRAVSPARRDAADTRATPETELLHAERHKDAGRLAEDFLADLRRRVNNNQRRYSRLIRTLWHIYFDPLEPSQLRIAEMLGVSDSLISDNRRLIEHELRQLSLSVEDARLFCESLRGLVAQACLAHANPSLA